jgi:hypothetical protein
MKVCSKCGIEKSLEEFSKFKRNPNGLARCKQCVKEDKSDDYIKHKARRAALNKIWRQNNKEYMQNYNKEYREKHKEEFSAYKKQWNIDNKVRRKELHWLFHYKLDSQKFDSICELQNNKCAICKTPIPIELTRHWCVDHGHKCCPDSPTCGQCTRGILCSSCNRGLGGFQDNIKVLKAAIEYLEKEREHVESIRGIECNNTLSNRDNREDNISTIDQ